jgi:hypothetical protein
MSSAASERSCVSMCSYCCPSTVWTVIFNLSLIALIQGCSGVTSGLPPKLYDDETSLSAPNDTLAFASIPTYVAHAGDPTIARNTFISLRMYSIDLEYSKYEAKLTTETEGTNLAGALINLGLTGTASVIPAGETTKVLSAAATAVTGANAAVDKDILLSQTIQSLQTQMRTDRSAKTSLATSDLVSYLKNNGPFVNINRSSYALVCNESASGQAGINNNYAGLQADVGRWGASYDHLISGTCVVRDSGGQDRRFLCFSKWSDCVDMVVAIISSRGLYVGGQTSFITTMAINTPDDWALAYYREWVTGNGSAVLSAASKRSLNSLYQSAVDALPSS